MRILVLADDDDIRHDLTTEPADLVLALGDLSDEVILRAAELAGCERIFAVKGNHDGAAPFPAPIVDLHLAVRTVDVLTFGGFTGSWKYKPRGHHLFTQDEAEKLLADFPRVDVMLCHNSPRWVHERDEEVHQGFSALNAYIERAKPRLLLHGHQHANRDTLKRETHVMGIYGQRRIEIRP